jgi:hypothetical protein
MLLAEAAANSSDMNYITTGALVVLLNTITGVLTYKSGQKSRTVKIEDQPVGFRLEKEYVTRTEFAEFKGELKADVREMRGSYDRLTMLIDERDKKLGEMIEKVASGAFEGRRRIHETVNEQGKQIAAIGVNTDVSKNIGKLGAAIMTHLKSCPVAQAQNQNPTLR